MALAMNEGGGDFRRGQEECHWDKLPCTVLDNICKYLNWKDHNHLGQVSKNMEYYMAYDYGIHALLPPRDWNLAKLSILRLVFGRLAGTLRHVTDDMTKRRILNMEGKVIRSLNMNEMHPDFDPFPFDRLIQRPFRLREVRLKYVDAQFVYQILDTCRNLECFQYKTGTLRHLPEGPLAWLLLGTTFQPVPIPSENDNLIQFISQLPSTPLQLDRLTSLSLSLSKGQTLHSDCCNLIFLLLLLSSSPLVTLKNFKFIIKAHWFVNWLEGLQIMACLCHFLARCPHLQTFEYASFTQRDRRWNRRIAHLPEKVISFLFEKYGSELLKKVGQRSLRRMRDREIMLESVTQLMREAGTALINLREATFRYSNGSESADFQRLASYLPSSLQKCRIDDYSWGSFNHYTLFLPSLPRGVIVGQFSPVYGSIEKLYLCHHLIHSGFRARDALRIISLSEVLSRMWNLKHFSVIPRVALDGKTVEERGNPDFGVDPVYYLEPLTHQTWDDNEQLVDVEGGHQIPDLTIERAAEEAIFQRVEVLNLEGVKLTTWAARRLVRCRNLKELSLLFIPEHRHNLFGIRSGDLIRILGSLRKLEKVSVNMILPPLNPTLSLEHQRTLEGIGRLRQMRRPKERQPVGSILMKQFKFLFDHEMLSPVLFK